MPSYWPGPVASVVVVLSPSFHVCTAFPLNGASTKRALAASHVMPFGRVQRIGLERRRLAARDLEDLIDARVRHRALASNMMPVSVT